MRSTVQFQTDQGEQTTRWHEASIVFLAGFLAIGSSLARADVFNVGEGLASVEFVPVGNPGNAGELSGTGAGGSGPDAIVGAVDYVYLIGKYEVTNAQWREFLTEKASLGDPYELYNTEMASTYGGIDRSGLGTVEDPYVYSAKGGDANWDNRPVNYVSFWDAARFCNWLHNGQGSGDTESGAYVNIGNLITLVRQSGAQYFIPTEDEWYKAAYYDPSGYDPDGPGGIDPGPGYWEYPTQSDTAPTAEAPAGTDMINGSANYWSGGFVDPTYYGTEVGAYSAKPSDSAHGTFDQGGNLWEWNETAFPDLMRGMRGGGRGSLSPFDLAATYRGYGPPTHGFGNFGFRVASIPEPGSITLLVCGAVAGLAWGRRRRQRSCTPHAPREAPWGLLGTRFCCSNAQACVSRNRRH